MSLFSRLKSSAKKGFTLVESLAVIAIIGILASLSIYTITQAQRQARDAVRKSDVSAIAQGFEARALDKTCSIPSDVGLYPGKELVTTDSRMIWWHVPILNNPALNLCNPFSVYLSSIPNDPKTIANPYYFNLSAKAGIEARHYRIAAKLEKEISKTSDQWKEICRQSDVWYDNFLGQSYDDCSGNTIGRATNGSKVGIVAYNLGQGLFSINSAQAGPPIPCQTYDQNNPLTWESCNNNGPPSNPNDLLPYNYYIGR